MAFALLPFIPLSGRKEVLVETDKTLGKYTGVRRGRVSNLGSHHYSAQSLVEILRPHVREQQHVAN